MLPTDELLCLINTERMTRRLPPLEEHFSLTSAARLHSSFMQEFGRFSHIGQHNSIFSERINRAEYLFSEAAENIAFCQARADQALTIWMHSDPHRKNLLSTNFRHIGIGLSPDPEAGNLAAPHYWTLNLAAPLLFENMETSA